MGGGFGGKAIRRWWPLVSSSLSFVVGNGMRVKFRKDAWCGGTHLSIAFPTLFALADSKEAEVRDCWSSCVDEERWNPSFIRFFNDLEVEDAERLLTKLGRYVLVPKIEDRVYWELSKDGIFSVRSMYQALQSSTGVSFPWFC